MSKDIIFNLVEEAEDESIANYLKSNKDQKAMIKKIHELESIHWYYIYRIKALKVLIRKNVYGTNLNIADIGVGTGTLSKFLKDRYENVTFFDNNFNVINYAKDVHDLDVQYGNMPWSVDIPIGSLDYLLMLNTLEYIEDDGWSLVSACEKLKKDGKLILSIPNNKKLYSISDKELGALRRYDKDEIEEKLFIAGLKIDYITYFESFVSFSKNLKYYMKKIIDEEIINFNEVPENNKQLIAQSQIDIELLEKKPLKHGNQMFLVCSKLTDEERLENEKKGFITKIVNKIKKYDEDKYY